MHKKTQEKTKNKKQRDYFPQFIFKPTTPLIPHSYLLWQLESWSPKTHNTTTQNKKVDRLSSSKNQWPPHSSTTHISLLTKNHLSFTYTKPPQHNLSHFIPYYHRNLLFSLNNTRNPSHHRAVIATTFSPCSPSTMSNIITNSIVFFNLITLPHSGWFITSNYFLDKLL